MHLRLEFPPKITKRQKTEEGNCVFLALWMPGFSWYLTYTEMIAA